MMPSRLRAREGQRGAIQARHAAKGAARGRLPGQAARPQRPSTGWFPSKWQEASCLVAKARGCGGGSTHSILRSGSGAVREQESCDLGVLEARQGVEEALVSRQEFAQEPQQTREYRWGHQALRYRAGLQGALVAHPNFTARRPPGTSSSTSAKAATPAAIQTLPCRHTGITLLESALSH